MWEQYAKTIWSWREWALRSEQLEAENAALQKMLESLTPGGSEFSGNPDRCAEWIMDRLNLPVKQQETIAALRERVEELERMLAERNLVVSHLLTKIEEFENLRDVRTFRNISRFVRSDDKNTCGWTPGENSFHWEYWNTECGHAFKFEGGGLEDNEFLYCSYCGKAIKVRKE